MLLDEKVQNRSLGVLAYVVIESIRSTLLIFFEEIVHGEENQMDLAFVLVLPCLILG